MKYFDKVILVLLLSMFCNVAYSGEVVSVKTSPTTISGVLHVKERYRASEEDTLDSITEEYIMKNTYGQRDFVEFRQGIIEMNPWLTKDYKFTDEILTICYWIRR